MPKGKPGAANNAYVHGHTTGGFSPTYYSWSTMLQRCTNPKRPYWIHYGGRGVQVCERWMVFSNFLADMGERPAGTSLDRIDANGNYEPGNCRWATRQQQANNKVRSRRVTLGGETKTVTEWCLALGISHNTVQSRMRKWGYSIEDALTRPRQDRASAARAMTQTRIRRSSGKE